MNYFTLVNHLPDDNHKVDIIPKHKDRMGVTSLPGHNPYSCLSVIPGGTQLDRKAC